MKGWILISTYGRVHQAELRKAMLEDYDINAVIINEKDRALLLGEIELWVEERNVEKAKMLLAEFEGLTKVDSFIGITQVERLEHKLNEEGLETKVIKRNKYFNSLPEYELFVKNEQSQKAIEIYNMLDGWQQINSFEKQVQAAYRIEKLEKENIQTKVINRRNENYDIETVELFVENKNAEKAEKLIQSFDGWKLLNSFSNKIKAVLAEGVLERENIPFIEFQYKRSETEFDHIDLFVKEENLENAELLINQRKDWVKVKSFAKLYNADFYKEILDEAQIDNVIISRRDNSFLLGEIYLYTEEDNAEEAIKLFNKIDKTNPMFDPLGYE